MKDIKLNTLPIAALHDRFGDINDIIRINVRHFIIYADDPDRYVSVWDMEVMKSRIFIVKRSIISM